MKEECNGCLTAKPCKDCPCPIVPIIKNNY